MNIQLIHGQFSASDAIDIITKMINVKIKFHESKITSAQSEEDIKMREKRIRKLQQELHESRTTIANHGNIISLTGELTIN